MVYKALKLATDKYPIDKLQHALRVANYARDGRILRMGMDEQECLYCVALLHDILEDTDVTLEELRRVTSPHVAECVSQLTRDKSVPYLDYIRKIKADAHGIAYAVKIADMKDHLAQTATLTDKLRDKYLEALPELL